MRNFKDRLEEELQDPGFKAEWEALEPEFQIIRAMLDARSENNITQKQLSELTGITQADLSRLENGSGNPSVSTLKRLASGLGKKLEIRFISPN